MLTSLDVARRAASRLRGGARRRGDRSGCTAAARPSVARPVGARRAGTRALAAHQDLVLDASAVGSAVGRPVLRRSAVPVEAHGGRVVFERAARCLEDDLGEVLYGFARVLVAVAGDDG